MAQNRKQQRLSANSFYRLGGIEILSMSRDERSGLWKIYLSTPEHYLVSREFDRTVGMYANAPDDVVRQGLMDFSDSIAGGQLSLFKVMDMFIDRCFDESVFDCNTENAVWMCIDYPSYQEVEEMLATYNCRLRWYSKDEEVGDLVDRALFRTPNGSGRSELASGLSRCFAENRVTTLFMNPDGMVERLLSDAALSEMPVFVGRFADNGDFAGFSYLRR